MQYTLSTVSAIAATLALTSAAPMPQSSNSANSVNIVRQFAAFDAAGTLRAQLNSVTPNNGQNVQSAALQVAGPWCAGFTDSQATQPAQAVNGDGIFDSSNEAVYSEDDAVAIGSWWCAATRKEVEDFVAGNDNNDNGNDNGNNGGNNDNGNNNNNGGDADATVRVTIETEAGTTFRQEELPANVGEVDASEVTGLGNGVVSISRVGDDGDCEFRDAAGDLVDISGNADGLVQIATFECRI